MVWVDILPPAHEAAQRLQAEMYLLLNLRMEEFEEARSQSSVMGQAALRRQFCEEVMVRAVVAYRHQTVLAVSIDESSWYTVTSHHPPSYTS